MKFKPPHSSSNQFQKTLSADIKNIQNNPKVIVRGDKTSNHYSVDKNEYQNVLYNNNITKEYKKSTTDNEIQVNKSDKNLATKLEIADRAEIMP